MVYVLIASWYEYYRILGVFSYQDGAERAIADYKENGYYVGWRFEIYEQTLED